MKKSIFSLLFLGAITCGSFHTFAQEKGDVKTQSEFSLTVKNGSIAASLKKYDIKKEKAGTMLNEWLGLSENYSFEKIIEQRDKLGFVQERYQQYFKGIQLKSGLVILHFKDGKATSINGRISTLNEKMDLTYGMSAEDALHNAQKELNVRKVLNHYPAELVILKDNNSGEFEVAWKVRVDGKNENGKLLMYNVYLHATTGKIIEKASIIAHADVLANASTLYSGIQEITTDSFASGYRLIDNGRNIHTYDVGGSAQNPDPLSPVYFETLNDITNDSTFWDQIPVMMSMTLLNAKPSLLTGLGQTVFPLSFVADAPPTDLDSFNALTFNPLFSVTGASSLPVTNNGLYLTLPKPSYSAGYAKVGFDIVTFGIEVLDSAYYTITDKTIGVHSWSDLEGSSGTYTMELGKNPALDAHWGMEKTHDYYLQKLNRDSYNDSGSVIRNYMNGMISVGFSQTNAAALPAPYNSMVYGLGDGELMGPVVGLDVMGHEFTHLVTASTSNLEYQGESGALNESFSDMFGTAIEFFAKGDSVANWHVGDGVVLVSPGYIRSMSDPKALAGAGNPNFAPQPDTYLKEYWVNTSSSNDNGGVHTNSGVGNKWFYLLTEGGTGVNDNLFQYNVVGIGMEKSEKIAYRTLTSYLTPTSQYVDAYYAALQAADDLYGDTSQAYQSVKDAWVAVGVLDSISAGIGEINTLNNKIQIYPNPTTGMLTVQNDIHNLSAELVTIMGTTVQQINLKKGQNKIDLSHLSKGIYILKMNSGSGLITKKVILK